MSQRKFVDYIQENNFPSQCFFRVSHILTGKWNFFILIVIFEIETKNIHFTRNCIGPNL